MFYRYEIKNNGEEDILYLYLTMAYEFSRELLLNSNNYELSRRTRNFIKNNNINYNGNKVYLVIDGIVVKTVDIAAKNTPVEILKESLFYSNEYFLVTIKMNDNSKIELPLKEYLLGVLATSFIDDMDIEVLKAICVLFRTYAFMKMHFDKEVDAYNNFVVYKPISYYKLVWSEKFDQILEKLKEAISDTDCLFLTYEDKYILPFIHFSNTGKTFYHKEYPYLSSVKSLWDLASPFYIETKDFDYRLISDKLGLNIDSSTTFKVLDIDSRDYVKRLSVGDKIFTGEEFRKILNLKSMNINIIINQDYVRIITKGYGNGLGLSIYGATELSKNGCNFANILNYYFPKVRINKYIKELP